MVETIRFFKILLDGLFVLFAYMASNVNSQVTWNRNICQLPYLGGDQSKLIPDGLTRMGSNSKYFIILDKVTRLPINKVADFCQSIDLRPVEIRHHIEYLAIQLFLKATVFEDITFSLGINDEAEEGSFKEFGGTPMQFHAFEEGEPDNGRETNQESCVGIIFRQEEGVLVYDDMDCNHLVTPACMFKPTDRCFLESPLTFASVNENFQLVGNSIDRDFYVKLKQYPWWEASKICRKAGFKLVDFDGLNNNPMLYDLLKKWIQRNHIFPRIPFWTGAKLNPADSVNPDNNQSPQYKFENSEKVFNDLSEFPSLDWDMGEPSDSTSIGLEMCISVILYAPYKPSGGNIFSIATTNCRIPHYPICYKEKSQQKVMLNETTEEHEEGEKSLAEKISYGRDLQAGKFCNLEEIKIDLSLPALSIDEVFKLAALRRHKDIHTDGYRFEWVKKDTWLTSIVDELYLMPKRVCPSISKEFINIMHNLLILYYNSVADEVKDPDEQTQRDIDEYFSRQFIICNYNSPPISFVSAGGLPVRYGKYSVAPVSELIDTEKENGNFLVPDMVIDTFWYLHLVSVGSCYYFKPGTKILWLQEFRYLFTTYYLEVFQKRWFSTKPNVDYGVIMGDVDVETAYYTLKACAIAVFHQNGISDLYYPRAVTLKTNHNDEELNLKMQDLSELADSEK